MEDILTHLTLFSMKAHQEFPIRLKSSSFLLMSRGAPEVAAAEEEEAASGEQMLAAHPLPSCPRYQAAAGSMLPGGYGPQFVCCCCFQNVTAWELQG